MYVPPAFKSEEAAALAFAAARGFGTLIAVDGGCPVAAPVPFLLTTADGVTKAQIHVARANPLHAVIARAPDVLLSVMGADHYISPDWYVSEEQVPTWNYVAVHLAGTARILSAEEHLAVVDRLSARFEADLAPKKPWLSAKMTPAKRDAMLRGIVAVDVTISKVEGKWKLSQNKSEADQQGAIAAIEKLGTPAARAYLDAWQAWRHAPHK